MQGSTRIDELRQKFHENPRRYFAPLANEYRKAGDPEQAIAICRAHLAQQPGHMSGHVVYAQALYDAKRTDEARSVFEKAIALDPDNAIVLRHLGDIAREKGETGEARHWYSRALEADPQDREAAAYLAELTEPLTGRGDAAETGKQSKDAEQPEVPDGAEAESQPQAPEPETAREPEAAQEPEAAAQREVTAETRAEGQPVTSTETEAEEPAERPEHAPWRKTPPHEESPFVTRTMAELYAQQGYREAALDVYRQLALQHPDDKEIFDRIEELELNEEAKPGETAGRSEASEPAGTHATDAATEVEPPEVPTPGATPLDIEPLITDAPVEAEPNAFADLSTGWVDLPSSEDLNLSAAGEDESAPLHFTEMEITTGATWDSDSWGAGLAGEDDISADFEPSDASFAPLSPEPDETPGDALTGGTWGTREPDGGATDVEAVESTSMETEKEGTEAGSEATSEAEGPEQQSPHAEAAEAEVSEDRSAAEEGEPPLVEVAWPESSPSEEAVSGVAAEQVPSQEPLQLEPAAAELADDSHFVAYSPQPPEGKDLPHFAPKVPTVREFFATLGAFRPPSLDSSSITAHAAASQIAAQPERAPASDTFSSLFEDAAVSEADSRAAFALSGALAATTPPPAEPAAPPPAEKTSGELAAPAPAQESEEDIRKFREWLDGLTES